MRLARSASRPVVQRGPRVVKPRPTRGTPEKGGGLVSLVGAGPGDLDLLTIRAQARLQAADLVLYDGLVHRPMLALAARARHESVARRVGPKALSQAAVTRRMIQASREGLRVVRLKSGDPFVFGRGGEEADALATAGVPYEVVPGISTAIAGPAAAGIPVTYRGLAAGFVVVSGHAPAAYEPVLDRVTPGTATLVVLMGLAHRARIGRRLVRAGWPGRTPAAIVVNASRREQRVWTGTLATLGLKDGIGTNREPGVIIVGDVVSLAARSGLAQETEETSWQPTTTRKH